MPQSCKDHRQVIINTVGDRIFIPDGSSRLNKSGYSCLVPELNTIIKREKGIGSHHSAVKIKLKLLCLFNSLANSIHPARLPATFPYKLPVLYQSYSI